VPSVPGLTNSRWLTKQALARDGRQKIRETEAMEREGHSTISEVEV
jgi:hypothetical protein